jgi:hypothetical protein
MFQPIREATNFRNLSVYENYFVAYVHFAVMLGVKFQIPISAINTIILNTGFISTKIAFQYDVKRGLALTAFQYRFSKLKSTAHATRMDVTQLLFQQNALVY